jgi:hypothetical protein
VDLLPTKVMEMDVSYSKDSGRIMVYPENSVLAGISSRVCRSARIEIGPDFLTKCNLAAGSTAGREFPMMASATDGRFVFLG